MTFSTKWTAATSYNLPESASFHILPTEPHVDTFFQQRSKGHIFSQGPINDPVLCHFQSSFQNPREAWVGRAGREWYSQSPNIHKATDSLVSLFKTCLDVSRKTVLRHPGFLFLPVCRYLYISLESIHSHQSKYFSSTTRLSQVCHH